MASPEETLRTTTALIRTVAERLPAVIDEEAAAHEAICSLVVGMAMGDGGDKPDIGTLVESLQYFDRLQQRATALSVLLQNLTVAIDLEDDPDAMVQAFCSTAPVAQDADWIGQLKQVSCDVRAVDAAQCETWGDTDSTQTF